MKKHIRAVLLLALILTTMYIIIYICFKGNGILTAGIDLEKRDWLAFLGTYLSLAGSIIVSVIAIFQSSHFERINKDENKAKRLRDIQPIFSIEITAQDSNIENDEEVILSVPQSRSKKHENVTFRIENVGTYPVKNVMFLGEFILQLLKCNSPHEFQIVYADSPDAECKNKSFILVCQDEYERNKNGLPKVISLQYEDVDGNNMYQIFTLKEHYDIPYYSLSEDSYT